MSDILKEFITKFVVAEIKKDYSTPRVRKFYKRNKKFNVNS